MIVARCCNSFLTIFWATSNFCVIIGVSQHWHPFYIPHKSIIFITVGQSKEKTYWLNCNEDNGFLWNIEEMSVLRYHNDNTEVGHCPEYCRGRGCTILQQSSSHNHSFFHFGVGATTSKTPYGIAIPCKNRLITPTNKLRRGWGPADSSKPHHWCNWSVVHHTCTTF